LLPPPPPLNTRDGKEGRTVATATARQIKEQK